MLVVIALAIYVYDFYQRVDSQQAGDEAAVIREQTKVLQQQAAEVKQQLQLANEQAEALRNQVTGERREEADRKEQDQAAAYLAEGLEIAASTKAAVVESYHAMAKWPANNHDAGVPEPGQQRGQSLQSLRLSGAGVISLTFDAKSGVDRGIVRLIPTVHPGGAVSWRCETPSYPDIAAMFLQCVYKPEGSH